MKKPMDLSNLEDSLKTKIGKSLDESSEDTVLGFIEVDETMQKEILDTLRRECRMGPVEELLGLYPSVITYALSVAAPIGMRDEDVSSGGFYSAWESAFGYAPPNGHRERLANAFDRAVEALGLPVGTISPDQAPHWKGGCYLFHSGILPHFVQPLRAALNQAQKQRPLPDPDDEGQCGSFAVLLSEKVHPAQIRLRKVLLSPIGAFLIRRLVRWHLTGDDSLFPAHVQELLAEQKGQGVFAQSPYLCFDEGRGVIQLALPAQNARLADSSTRWEIPGHPPLRAATSRPPIDLADLEGQGGSLRITLSHLKGGLESIEHPLRGGLSESVPFLIFDADRNKEQRTGFDNLVIGLRPGRAYLVLLSDGMEIASGHRAETVGDSRFVRYQANPADEALGLRCGDRSWRLEPAVKPGLYLSRDEGSAIQVQSNVDAQPAPVSYGEGFGLTCCLPASLQAERVIFSTAFDEGLSRPFPLPAGISRLGLKMIDLGPLLMDWLSTLPSAVHAITVKVPFAQRTLSLGWMFWKGLERITIYGDLRWSSPPANLPGHPGFSPCPSGLNRERRHGGHAEIHLARLGRCESERWSLPSNHVRIYMVAEDGSGREVGHGEKIDLVREDRRVVQFQTGGLMPVKLTANGKLIGVIFPDRPILCRYPSALLAEAGKTATLHAETLLPVPGEAPWPLLSWQSPLTAKECRTPEVAAESMTWLVPRISLADLAGLRVALRRVDRGFIGLEESFHEEIAIPETTGSEEVRELAPGLHVRCTRRENGLDVKLEFDRTLQQGAVWSAELEGRLEDSSAWQTLVVPEKHGRLAQVRLLLIGADPGDGSAVRDFFWSRAGEELPTDSAASALTPDGLRHAIAETARLLSWKYPTPIWQQNVGRIKTLVSWVSAAAARAGEVGRTAWWRWAIASLARHSREFQPVVIPEFPLLHGLKLAASPLKGCDVDGLPNEGVVARSFAEAIRFENREGSGCYAYLSSVFGERPDVDRTVFEFFSGFNRLIQGQDGPLGELKLKDWNHRLYEICQGRGLELDDDEPALLSAGHYVRSLTKAKRRCQILISVSSAEAEHWLSTPISRLQSSLDGVEQSIRELLGPKLQGAPVDLLWRPFTETPLGSDAGEARDILRAVLPGNLLIALALRKHAAGLLSSDDMLRHLRKIVGSDTSPSKLHDQAALLIATAPELFSFYFLLFTLAP